MKKESLYLVAYYTLRPANRVKTQIKGWMEDSSNVQYDEQVAITRRLKNNDRSMAKIILDMTNKKIVRNGWGTDVNFDDMFKYFSKSYPEYTHRIMASLDPEYLTRFQTQVGTAEEAKILLAAKGMADSEIQVVDTSALGQ
jgi:hypothetical protein